MQHAYSKVTNMYFFS